MSPVFKRFVLMFTALALFLPVLAACADDENGDNGDNGDQTEETDNGAEDEEDGEATEEEDDEATEEEDGEATEEEDGEATEEEDGEATEEEDGEATEEEDGEGDAGSGQAPEDAEPISFAVIEGWPEGVAVTEMWAVLLEERGYEVETTSLDVAPMYAGLSQGDVDVYMDGWLPATHGEYMDEYGDSIEDLGVWYEDALLALTVPQYVADEGVESLEDLQDNADMFDSTITGIEPGAGMMATAVDEVMPTYGLDDWTLTESSTAAMLSELETAIENEEPIVVTLWEPHWAYDSFDLHNLEDPETAWGEPDSIHTLAREGFSEDYPQVAGWMENFQMETDQIGGLVDYVTVQSAEEDGDPREYAQMWLEEEGGQDLADEWMQ